MFNGSINIYVEKIFSVYVGDPGKTDTHTRNENTHLWLIKQIFAINNWCITKLDIPILQRKEVFTRNFMAVNDYVFHYPM
jgi:hypothetical protein